MCEACVWVCKPETGCVRVCGWAWGKVPSFYKKKIWKTFSFLTQIEETTACSECASISRKKNSISHAKCDNSKSNIYRVCFSEQVLRRESVSDYRMRVVSINCIVSLQKKGHKAQKRYETVSYSGCNFLEKNLRLQGKKKYVITNFDFLFHTFSFFCDFCFHSQTTANWNSLLFRRSNVKLLWKADASW